MLVRVEACGICHTDLKKIEHNLLPPPRIFGHETAGVVVGGGRAGHASSGRATAWSFSTTSPAWTASTAGSKLYAQCAVYKKVGVTAGFEPAGGGFAQYVRVMDWIVRARRGEDSGGRLLRARQLRGAGEHLPQGGGAVRSAARRDWC